MMEVVANSYEGLMAGTRIGKERKRKRARRAGIPQRGHLVWTSYDSLEDGNVLNTFSEDNTISVLYNKRKVDRLQRMLGVPYPRCESCCRGNCEDIF